jgi:hypothetical protein
MVQYRIVVARYTESLNWTQGYPCIVYNKGPQAYSGCINLPNIGREAHTYLHHIVTNYENLDNYTVFLQGNPFDHSPNCLRTLDIIARMSEIPDFMHISERILPTSSEQDLFFLNEKMLPMKEFHTYLFGETPRRNFVFGAGAQFVVSRKLIQHIPKETYQKLLEKSTEGIGAWILERFWEQIFTSGTFQTLPLVL